MKFVVHYSEIALKGKNRSYFINKLVRHIKAKLPFIETIEKKENRLFLVVDESYQDVVKETLARIFGISWFAPIFEEKTYDSLKEAILTSLERNILFKESKSFKVETKRSYKGFPKTSLEISSEIASLIKDKFNKTIDLKKPDFIIYVRVLKDTFYYFFEKIRGQDGLPLASVGKLLSLFSGGIDSPVASYLMMRRGCEVDFIHFYALDLDYVMKSKIIEQIKALSKFQIKTKLYLVPYKYFHQRAIAIPERYDMILFRRFMFKLSEKVAKKYNYGGLITGDNLGQVASQTLENLYSAIRGLDILIFQPLIGFNKQEIIDISKKIGLFELSTKKYKDCCSIISRRPATRSKPELIANFAQTINLEEVIDKSIDEMTLLEF